MNQPPSGGCVLKHEDVDDRKAEAIQPPSGGCVLKHEDVDDRKAEAIQPPSGGCVLKLLRSLSWLC